MGPSMGSFTCQSNKNAPHHANLSSNSKNPLQMIAAATNKRQSNTFYTLEVRQYTLYTAHNVVGPEVQNTATKYSTQNHIKNHTTIKI